MVAEVALDVVADFKGLMHDLDPVFEFVGGVGEQLALADELGLLAVGFLSRVRNTSISAPMRSALFLSWTKCSSALKRALRELSKSFLYCLS